MRGIIKKVEDPERRPKADRAAIVSAFLAGASLMVALVAYFRPPRPRPVATGTATSGNDQGHWLHEVGDAVWAELTSPGTWLVMGISAAIVSALGLVMFAAARREERDRARTPDAQASTHADTTGDRSIRDTRART